MIDLTPILKEVLVNYHLFDRYTFRQDTRGSPHTDTRTIFLRMCEPTFEAVFNSLESHDWFASLFPHCMHAVYTLGTPGRVMLVEMRAQGHIPAHVDEGAYCAAHDRFHLPLTGKANFRIGKEWTVLSHGKWHQIDNKQEHEVKNSDSNRIHLIADIRR